MALIAHRLFARNSSSTSVLWRNPFSFRKCSSKSSKNESKEDLLRREIEPSNIQKRILVWTKIYKNVNEIPSRIPIQQMNRSMDWFRGRMMIVMMGLGLVGFYMAIRSGRNLRDSGDSLAHRGSQQVCQWQEQEKSRQEETAPKTSNS